MSNSKLIIDFLRFDIFDVETVEQHSTLNDRSIMTMRSGTQHDVRMSGEDLGKLLDEAEKAYYDEMDLEFAKPDEPEADSNSK